MPNSSKTKEKRKQDGFIVCERDIPSIKRKRIMYSTRDTENNTQFQSIILDDQKQI